MLRAQSPDIAEAALTKYKGREAIPQRAVPELRCSWGDCVLFGTVHPAQIRDAFVQTGHRWPEDGLGFLTVRVDSPVFTPRNTVIWLFTDTGRTDLTQPKTDVVPYSPERVAAADTLQHGTLEYLREMKGQRQRPLLFVGVPHVLHRGAVPFSECDEIIV